MLIDFFFTLRNGGLPVSVTEYLALIEGLEKHVAHASIDDFYHLSRTAMVKKESDYDKFDRAFGAYFEGLESLDELFNKYEIPADWLEKRAELGLSDEEKKLIESLGGWEKLMEALKERLENQDKRHQGGNKNIGTAGRSPFGAYGYNPEGVRIGQKESRHRRAVKVWDKREFRGLDDSVEIGTRNIKVALKRLRKFTREGHLDELDLDNTISSTAKNAGYLDIKMRAEKRNRINVLILFDIGGSMDDHIKICEELFSAARSELKHMEFYYFHNFIYERLWKTEFRKRTEYIDTFELMRKYGKDYKLIIVGDATMSPYEITYPGASVEHYNQEAGAVWLNRLTQHFTHSIWLNPVPLSHWGYTPSLEIAKELMEDRMYPLTLEGLTNGMKRLMVKG
ncbi:MAG: VWA domain-containing protein [Gammaproteobacteria bacterium]|nr:VWA domain-containing protein [Gammaproteobacteria bacterium]